MDQNLKSALELLLRGDLNVWESCYHDLLFKKVMAPKLEGVDLLTYDYADRDVLYRAVHSKAVGNRPIDYLEFGVFQGESMRKWAAINTNPKSRFYGFDSFEGLPEDWAAGQKKKGDFTTQGRMPETGDPRVSFVKGWFNKTLVPFLKTFTPQNTLVLHMDADLFSSTLYVLMTLDPIIKRGTVAVFDDFNAVDDFAALHHYSRACGREWSVVAARDNLGKIGIVIH
ncbi:MAG: TylF/MycF/NovP-related O-methyltransferase [Thermodesulfobacteriota bacterium]